VGDLHTLFTAFGAVFGLAVLASWLPLARLRSWLSERRTGLGRAAVLSVLVGCAVMASRPLWWQGRFTAAAATLRAVASRQQSAGLTIDPTRSYDEMTVNWLGWYFGWPATVLAAAGLALLLWQAVRARNRTALALFATLGTVSLFYMNQINITPDQIWASRRLLPVTFPGTVIAAGFALYRLSRRPRWRWPAGALALVLVLGPILPWGSLFSQTEFDGEFGAVQRACAVVDRGSAGDRDRYVVLAGDPTGSGSWAPTLTAVCHATVLTVPSATPQALAQVRANWGDRPVTVLTFRAAAVRWAGGVQPAPQFSGRFTLWEQSLVHRPQTTAVVDATFWAGTLGAGDTVTALPA
jgi:hypothetical protein